MVWQERVLPEAGEARGGGAVALVLVLSRLSLATSPQTLPRSPLPVLAARGASGCFSPTKRGVDVDLFCCLAPTSRVGEGESGLTAAFISRMGHHGASVLTSSCSPCHGPAPLSYSALATSSMLAAAFVSASMDVVKRVLQSAGAVRLRTCRKAPCGTCRQDGSQEMQVPWIPEDPRHADGSLSCVNRGPTTTLLDRHPCTQTPDLCV